MAQRYFQTISAEEHKLISQKGGQAKRGRYLDKAWADQEALRQKHQSGVPIKELAEQYKVKEHSMWRIIRGK